jgi:glycosyltransferase involved in cell wall biosynthesis
MQKIVAVIPAFNESGTIYEVVMQVFPLVNEVIVVNDCSTDDTAVRAATAGAVVLHHDRNRGYDASLNTGVAEAVKRGASIVVTFDADGEHSADDIPKIIAPILSGRADVVAAQRPNIAHFSEMLFGAYTSIRFGIGDPLCGFKAYHRRVYDRFGFFDSVGSIGTELMLRAHQIGFRLETVPIKRVIRADTSRFYVSRLRGSLKILRAMCRVAIAVR